MFRPVCRECLREFEASEFDSERYLCFACAHVEKLKETVKQAKQARQDYINGMADDLVIGKNREKKQVVDSADIKK